MHACAAIRVVQDNDDAVAFGLTFARILERVILGDTVANAIASVQQLLHHGTGNPNDAFFAHGARVCMSCRRVHGPCPRVSLACALFFRLNCTDLCLSSIHQKIIFSSLKPGHPPGDSHRTTGSISPSQEKVNLPAQQQACPK